MYASTSSVKFSSFKHAEISLGGFVPRTGVGQKGLWHRFRWVWAVFRLLWHVLAPTRPMWTFKNMSPLQIEACVCSKTGGGGGIRQLVGGADAPLFIYFGVRQ